MLRSALVIAGVAAALTALPAAAQAGVVSRTENTMTYTPSPFADDVFAITEDTARDEAVFLGSDNLDNGAGCPEPTSTAIRCSLNNIDQVNINLAEGVDSVVVGGLFGGGPFSVPITIDAGSGDDVLSMGTERDVIFGGTGDDNLLGNDGGGNVFGGDGNDKVNGGGGTDFLFGNDGNDDIQPGAAGADDISGGAGADRVFFSNGNDTITLDNQPNDGVPGQGANVRSDIETIDSGAGNDRIVGDANPNILNGGAGADDIAGGANFDQIIYPFTGEQRVTLDGVANDGVAGEGDNVRPDVESVATGPGNDTLIGNAEANTLDGGDGNDELTGGGGVDTFLGGTGDDRIFARDGLPERVDCGPGGGAATVDTIDTTVGCTTVDADDDQILDVDRDGVDAPQDCNDRNPAIRPGAREILNNTVDENCDGRADFDRDLDGVQSPPGGGDCNDVNARISPKAREIPGNRVDEDCDGTADPFPPLGSSIGAFFVIDSGGTRFTDLFVRNPRKGARVRIACSGGGCPKRDRTVKITRTRRTLKLMRFVRGVELRPGARFAVRVTKRGTIGAITRFRVRERKPPARRDDCLFPGRPRPRRCPG